jgi:hypothetical protein
MTNIPIWERDRVDASGAIEQCRQELVEARRNDAKKLWSSNIDVLRVSQLDSAQIDWEINNCVRNQFMKIFKYFKVQFFNFVYIN